MQRESVLVTQIEAMEKQMQKYVQVSNQTPYPPYPLPKILFTTPFVHGLPVRDGRPSTFNASQTC